MKIYKVSQDENDGYDTYNSFVCYAEDEDTARNTHPDGRENIEDRSYVWTKPEFVKVEYLGESNQIFRKNREIICASFNAG